MFLIKGRLLFLSLVDLLLRGDVAFDFTRMGYLYGFSIIYYYFIKQIHYKQI